MAKRKNLPVVPATVHTIAATKATSDEQLAASWVAGGLRISELVALTWGQVILRDGGKVQLNVLGKGSKPRQVLLPEVVSKALLRLRGDDAPIFTNRAGGPLTDRAINYMLKAAAERSGLPGGFSPTGGATPTPATP